MRVHIGNSLSKIFNHKNRSISKELAFSGNRCLPRTDGIECQVGMAGRWGYNPLSFPIGNTSRISFAFGKNSYAEQGHPCSSVTFSHPPLLQVRFFIPKLGVSNC